MADGDVDSNFLTSEAIVIKLVPPKAQQTLTGTAALLNVEV